MKWSYCLKFVCLIIIVPGCSSLQKLKEHRSLLKEYAYCRCYELTSGDSTIFKRDVSLGVYIDLAGYDWTVFSIIDSLTQQVTSHPTPPELRYYGSEKSAFFDCFLFYHSKQLDSLVKSLNKYYSYPKWE